MNGKRALAVATSGLVLTCAVAACSSSYSTPDGLVVIHNEAGVDHDTATSDATSDAASPDPESGPPMTCSSKQPSSPTSTATVLLIGPQFVRANPDGGTVTNGWSFIGFDLDHQCTDLTSLATTCKAVAGADPMTLTDGVDGIDNSFGRNIVPILTNLSASSISLVMVDVTKGKGMLYLGGMGGSSVIGVPVVGAIIDIDASGGGTFSATSPTAALQVQLRAAFGRASPSLCTGTTTDSVLMKVAEASDMLADGTQGAASTCAGISLGVQFTGTSIAMPPAALVDPCSQ